MMKLLRLVLKQKKADSFDIEIYKKRIVLFGVVIFQTNRDIEPKTAYYFDIQDPNNTYYFLSSKDYNVLYYDESYKKIYINNQTLLKEGDYIYVNSYLNVSEKSKLYIINSDEKDIFDYFKNENSKYILSTWKIALIMIVFLL